MTTDAESAGSPEGCPRCESHGRLIQRARGMLERAADRVEGEIGRLLDLAGCTEPGSPEMKRFQDDLRLAEKTLMQLQDFLAKADDAFGPTDEDIDGALDLEAARAEIESRLGRLAAD